MGKNFTMTKKQLMAVILAFTLGVTGLAGCKKNTDSSETSFEPTTTTTIEATEPSSEPTVANMMDEANSLYEANKDFFVNQYGDDKEAAIKDINNALLILSNNAKDINDEDLRYAFYALDNMFMPTNVIQAAGNYFTGKEYDHIDNIPNLGVYVKDDAAKAIIIDNTKKINKFIDELNNGTEESKEAARKELLERVIDIQLNLNRYYYLGELSTGDELALNMNFKGLVNLTGSLVVNGVVRYVDNDGVEGEIPLIADARSAAILNTFRFAEIDGAPFDTMEIDGAIVNGRYIEYLGPNGFEREFVTQAEKNRIEDDLAITKYDEATVLVENKIAEQNNYLSDCEPKTLTK